jgi:hypothetical protein
MTTESIVQVTSPTDAIPESVGNRRWWAIDVGSKA